ncbi:MAG: putative zinc-binding metallopeptidase [Nibricoccus sp.]
MRNRVAEDAVGPADFSPLKTFTCSSCRQPVFFENIRCECCGSALGFVAAAGTMLAFSGERDDAWKSVGRTSSETYKPCRNYRCENVCNWVMRTTDENEFCESCRLTEIIPALSQPENKDRWFRLEQAKRRLIYSLLGLKLPLRTRIDDPERGLSFRLLEQIPGQAPILTGHADGVVTLNIAEADDAHREKTRTAMREPYRTLLGHFRHEIGHYFWMLLVDGSEWLGEFRKLFGDERQNYAQALKSYYDNGAPANWAENFISAYASAHPWEDWAETWAHYLHVTDGLDTARAWGVNLQPPKRDVAAVNAANLQRGIDDFGTKLLEQWLPLTRFLNSLNRSLGHADAYPFTVATPVLEKLRFIDRVIKATAETPDTGNSEPADLSSIR